MKKIIVLILLILFSLPVFAEYKPIPKDKQAQYKIEVEKYSERIDLTIKSINQKINQQRELFVEATKIKDKSSDKPYCKYVFYKNEWLCLNDNAKVVFSLPYPRYSDVGNFIEERSIISKKIKNIENDTDKFYLKYCLVKFSIVDMNGNIIKFFEKPALYIENDGETFANYSPQFYNGYAKINFVNNKDISKITKLSQIKIQPIYIDKMGNIVDKDKISKFTYDMLNNAEFVKYSVLPDMDLIPKAMKCKNNQEKICFAYIDNKGKTKIKPIIDASYIFCGDWYSNNPFFYKGRALTSEQTAEQGTYYFYIDKKGNKINKNIYRYAEPFYDNFAAVQLLNGEYALIDINGNIVWSKEIQEKTDKK